MISVERVEVLTAELPFRFSFGHALAARRSSTNVYVRLTLDDGTVGYGEGVPREYVTGETVDGAVDAHRRASRPRTARAHGAGRGRCSGRCRRGHGSRPIRPRRLLRAGARASSTRAASTSERSVSAWLGPRPAPPSSSTTRSSRSPSPRKLPAIAVLIRALGSANVKVKVGADLEADVRKLRAAASHARPAGRPARRRELRVDDADEALDAIGRMRALRHQRRRAAAAADDLEGSAPRHGRRRRDRSSSTSRCGPSRRRRTLADARACDAFNIRVSKCGGLLNSLRIARDRRRGRPRLHRRRAGRRERASSRRPADTSPRRSRRATSRARPAACS